jgi:hypothetical protein
MATEVSLTASFFQPRSNNFRRSRFAARQAAVLTLSQSLVGPEQHGESFRFDTMPSR